MIEIDGGYAEGGGQILRTAIGLSVYTGKAVRIFNIRAKRPNPGLRPQHLEGLKAAAKLCNAKLIGAEIGSKEVVFKPGKIFQDEVKINIETAGSVGLIFQILKIAALCCDRLRIEINGGATFGKFAPPLLYTKKVLLPFMQMIGYHAEIDIIRHGFYPKGGARCKFMFYKPDKIRGVKVLERKTDKVKGISIATKHLQIREVADRQAKAVLNVLQEFKPEIDIEYVDAICPGSGVVLWSDFLGSDAIGEVGKSSEDVGREAAEHMLKLLKTNATVDEHLSDQILPLLALADTESAFRTTELTMHAKTNMWVIQKFLKTRFEIEEKDGVLIRIIP